jgi:hypothetical protein
MTRVRLTTPEGVERFQQVVRTALERLDALRLTDDLDESFYEALRTALVAADATEREIDALAVCYVVHVVECTAPHSETRLEQFELIGAHLACTDMEVRIGTGDCYVWVAFPNRPKVH